VPADDQTATIAFLSDPSTFGVDKVDRVDTHISCVFLAGDRAYKLKRAVRFSYLDFSTADLRRAACESELTLNRRTAPDIYLCVEAIRREEDGRVRFGGNGRPVDFVVVMRRFDESSVLDNVARHGRLTREIIRDVADAIAAFHELAERDASGGSPEWLTGVIEGNDSNMRLAGGQTLDPAAISALTEESKVEVKRMARLIEERRQGGKVRRCHGDLHLRNICLLDHRPTLFDCIEFDPALATVDVLYDLSFLLMDLHHRGFPQWVNLAFNRYFDIAGETAGARLLPFFMSVHAAIRSHVSMASAPRVGSARADEIARGATAYLAEARQLLARPAPALLAVGGASGTGKSTLAYGAAPLTGGALGARVLRSDVIRKRLAGKPPETRLSPESYTPAASQKVYEAMIAEAAALLRAGHAVILDAVFGKADERDAARRLAGECGVPFRPLWLQAGNDIRRRRVETRGQDASDATPTILEAQLSQIENPTDWPTIDVGEGREHSLAAAKTYLLPAGFDLGSQDADNG